MKTHRIICNEITQKESQQTKVNAKALLSSLLKIVPLW